jgi:DNA mismatch endonuclease (patch repair protein)
VNSVRIKNRDRLTRKRRSWNMSRIRGKHTMPERVVRSLLHRLGYRFRLHRRIRLEEVRSEKSEVRSKTRTRVPRFSPRTSPLSPRYACPDIVLPKHRLAIFVHGCFWHRHRGCKNCTTPTHRRDFWVNKLEGNVARDKLHQRALKKLGWRVMVIWECETEKPDALRRKLTSRSADWQPA